MSLGRTKNEELEEDMPSASNYNHSNFQGYLINEVYRTRIEEDVNFRLLMSYMPFMKHIMSDIYTMEKNGNKKDAAIVFFNYLKDVEVEGKYQIFVEALRLAKYPILVKALENKEDIVVNDDEQKQLINIFLAEITETINSELLTHHLQMKDVITSEEGDQIRKTARRSEMDANFELLLMIPHRSEGWYEIFMNILLEHGHNHLVKKIDPKLFAQKKGSSEEKPIRIIENESLPLSVPVDMPTSRLTKNTNLAISNVGESKKGSNVKMAANIAPVPNNPFSQSVQRERTAVPASEFKIKILSELLDLKSLFHEQTKYMKDLLQQTEQIVRRVDSLEKKMNDAIRSNSSARRK